MILAKSELIVEVKTSYYFWEWFKYTYVAIRKHPSISINLLGYRYILDYHQLGLQAGLYILVKQSMSQKGIEVYFYKKGAYVVYR